MPPKAAADEETASPEELLALVHSATNLLLRLDKLEEARGKNCGIHKFRRKVLAEREFIESMRSGIVPPLKTRVAGSNLPNLLAVVDVAEKQHEVVAIDKRFAYTERDEKKYVTVDVVANGGALWIKVTARNVRTPPSPSLAWPLCCI
jgi:hypothetical protein